jgi:hypothetical protein
VNVQRPDRDDVRTEYAVIASYVTAMTGMRFQTVTIFLAAVGLIATAGNQSPRTGLLILVVSIGLWILDLRNREILRRLGARGSHIEEHEWRYEDRGAAGPSGFFLDGEKRAGIRLLGLEPWVPHGLAGRALRHEFAIDVVFVGVAAYAVTLFF